MDRAIPTGAQLLPVLARLVRLLRQADTSDGLSSVATAVLGRLGRDGAQRLTDLARSERASQPGMTQLVGRLERDGLVRRTSAPADRRGVLVEVTDAGRQALARGQAQYAAVLDELLGRLAPVDRDAIGAALPALSRLADAAGQPAQSGTAG
jgi:DNA-binding MarR family transcriptional regulator